MPQFPNALLVKFQVPVFHKNGGLFFPHVLTFQDICCKIPPSFFSIFQRCLCHSSLLSERIYIYTDVSFCHKSFLHSHQECTLFLLTSPASASFPSTMWIFLLMNRPQKNYHLQTADYKLIFHLSRSILQYRLFIRCQFCSFFVTCHITHTYFAYHLLPSIIFFTSSN